MARGERETGWEEAGDGATQGTGGFKLPRQQPRCRRGGCERGRGTGDSEQEPYPRYIHTRHIYPRNIYTYTPMLLYTLFYDSIDLIVAFQY